MDSSRGQPSGEGIADSRCTQSSGNRGEWAESGCSSGRRRAGNRAEREAGELGRTHRAGNRGMRSFDERIGRETARGVRLASTACGQLYGVRVTGPEMRRVGSKTRAGRQHGDGAVERLAVDTLRTAFGGERASAGFER